MSHPTAHNDILWKIFDTIACPEQTPNDDWNRWIYLKDTGPPAIKTLLRASHVCRAWRNIIIFSSSIWGRCLDFDELNAADEAWQAEVIRRTGDALLNITMRGRDDHKEFDESREIFLGSFISQNWHRVRSLRVTISAAMLETDFRTLHKTPAPYLEVFECWRAFWRLTNDSIFSRRDYQLITFGEHAPMLRQMDILRCNSLLYEVSPNAHWIKQLRFLKISLEHSASQFLPMLTSANLLERLSITMPSMIVQNTFGTLSSLPVDKVMILPFLIEINIDCYDRLQETLAILERIDISSCRIFCLDVTLTESPSDDDVMAMGHVLTTHLRGRKVDEEMTSISLIAEPCEIIIAFQGFRFYLHGEKGFSIHIPNVIPLIKPLFISSHLLQHVRTATLIFNFPESSTYAHDLERDDIIFPHLITSLTSLTHLSTYAYTLKVIHKWTLRLELDGHLTLPSLENINGPHSLSDCLEEFLGHRFSASSKPIKAISLGAPKRLEDRKKRAFLERFGGLKISWTTDTRSDMEYVCGSGTPDLLFF
ncbi:hypothetical protein D9613_006493 [Agrocybe pediades]|uniref:F-box domain-containing protein n=1 Tax=Agrocybe pediades TaxID=84607 RepID=A0A8H4VHX5_9AGAR|nr:hypothetical protein D9613_006493 [Agrocybe pediades]